MRAVIVQPLYLPWMGYFGMIEAADKFVFLDCVQFEYGSWQRRNRIKMPNGQLMWLSVPVKKHFGQKISEVVVNNAVDWRKEHLASMRFAYSRAPFFSVNFPWIEEIYGREWTHLSQLDTALVTRMCEAIGMRTDRLVFASDLNPQGKKTDLLIDILQKIGADEYISGPAARGYLDIKKLEEHNLRAYWFEFHHPVYRQSYGDFVPQASAIDLLFSTGPQSLELIRKGIENALSPAV